MPKYSYTAKSLKGEEKKGTIEAKDTQQISQLLKEEGFLLVKAELQIAQKKEHSPFFEIFKGGIPFFDKLSLTEKMLFTRNLQVMVASGLSLPRALETLALQTKNQKFKKAITAIRETIVRGENFSDALKKYPDFFSELYQNMLKVGEESGTMEEVLKVLARQMEKEHELRSKIIGALIYPAVVILAMFGIGIMMLVVVVPQLAETFSELKIELPLTTRVVIGLGTFLSQRWYLLPFIILGVWLLFSRISKSKAGKKFLDTIIMRVPVMSALIKKTNSAYMVRNLSSLMSAGVPIVRSLEIVSTTLDNFYFRDVLTKAAEKVGKGEKLSEALSPYQDIYNPVILQMLKVGEETGETSSILQKLADFFEEEVGNEAKNLTSIVEPVLMLIIGAAIGFFAISMVQPMYSMLGAIQ